MHEEKPSRVEFAIQNSLTTPKGLHRRNSSRWIPATAPIYERALDITTVSLKNRFFNHHKERAPDRVIDPNWLQSDLPRYRLPNYRNYPDNKISTSKYTWLTFIPKNLWEQFHRWANIYFIIIMSMNWIPALRAFSKYLGMIPVIVILTTTAIKDFIEDWRRKRADHRLNHNTVHVWDTTKKRFRKTLWELVLVGDLIHVSLDEKLPADIVLIRSSDPQGCVFVETANLDGENNLKQKVVVTKCKEFCDTEEFDPSNLYLRITCNQPDNRLNHIVGSVYYNSGEKDKISKENVILRGCQVRNTAFAEGIVIYTGKETKLMLSNGSVKYKRSSLERITNYFILFCVLLLVFLVVSGGVCAMIWLRAYKAHEKIIPFIVTQTKSAVTEGLINMAAYILVYQTLIPLSLYISIEMIKLGQNYLMSNDLEMYDTENDKKMLCRSLNIPEELGQIKYILSDKTGTLTENKMVFRSCSIESTVYDPESLHKHRRSTLKSQPTTPSTCPISPNFPKNPSLAFSQAALTFSQPAPTFSQVPSTYSRPEPPKTLHPSRSAPSFSVKMVPDDQPKISLKLQRELAAEMMHTGRSSRFFFLLNMCVCNTVMVRRKQKLDDVDMGFVEDNVYNVGNSAFFLPVDQSQTVTTTDTPKTSELTPSGSFARHFTFAPNELIKRIGSLSSIFKRRQVMAKRTANVDPTANFDAESPDELALVKAADAYGFTLLTRSTTDIRVRLPNSSSPSTPENTIFENEIELEVLKILPFDSIRKRMSILVRLDDEIILLCKGADEQVIPNLDPDTNTPEMIEKTKEILENYGRTGLRTLCMAMRKVSEEDFNNWMESREYVEGEFTDDTPEISESSQRIETKMKLLGVTAIEDRLQDGVTECIDSLRMAGIQVWVLTGDKCETAINIAKSCHLFNSHLEIVVFRSLEDIKRAAQPRVLINAVFSSEIIKLMKEGCADVFKVIESCSSIVCYRMTPAEKAEVVKAVKTRLKGKTLAIGDGANDVPMILSADVGIGISGREGLQAVMASDFAISRFRFLNTLLLVHGHWNYYRLSNAILYFLEKNAVFVLVIYWEQLYNGFSSGFFIDPIYSMLYPIVFTAVQPIVYSIFDQDASRSLLLKYPHLYEQGRENKLCTTRAFALTMLDAFWQSGAIFFIAYLCFEESSVGFWQLGFVISTAMFFANSFHLALEVKRWTTPMVTIFALFVLIHFLFFMVYTSICTAAWGTKNTPLNVAFSLLKLPQFWTCVFLGMSVAIMPRIVIRLIWNRFWPDLCQKTIIEERKH